MTVDKVKLKALAEGMKGWDKMNECWPCDENGPDWQVGRLGEDDNRWPLLTVDTEQYDQEQDAPKVAQYYAAANPAAVLALIAESDRNAKNAAEWEAASLYWMAERDQLKAKLAELEVIGALINSQDNRHTDQPMFAVMEKRGMVTLDTHDHDRIEWYDPVNVSTADDRTASRLEALHRGGRDVKDWERYAIKDVDVFVTACFTEQGCKDFLAIDGHNHREPFIYAFGSFRNSEYQAMRNWLKSLPKKTGD